MWIFNDDGHNLCICLLYMCSVCIKMSDTISSTSSFCIPIIHPMCFNAEKWIWLMRHTKLIHIFVNHVDGWRFDMRKSPPALPLVSGWTGVINFFFFLHILWCIWLIAMSFALDKMQLNEIGDCSDIIICIFRMTSLFVLFKYIIVSFLFLKQTAKKTTVNKKTIVWINSHCCTLYTVQRIKKLFYWKIKIFATMNMNINLIESTLEAV